MSVQSPIISWIDSNFVCQETRTLSKDGRGAIIATAYLGHWPARCYRPGVQSADEGPQLLSLCDMKERGVTVRVEDLLFHRRHESICLPNEGKHLTQHHCHQVQLKQQ